MERVIDAQRGGWAMPGAAATRQPHLAVVRPIRAAVGIDRDAVVERDAVVDRAAVTAAKLRHPSSAVHGLLLAAIELAARFDEVADPTSLEFLEARHGMARVVTALRGEIGDGVRVDDAAAALGTDLFVLPTQLPGTDRSMSADAESIRNGPAWVARTVHRNRNH